jgi:hypothetical protein
LLRRTPLARPLVALALAALAIATGVSARADVGPTEAEINQARERFAAARKLENAGHWAEALTLLQRVAEVRTTPQVRFHIALCMEHVGMWTQALDGYAQAASEAGAAAPEVVSEANEHLRALQLTTPTVCLHVAGAASGDELLLDHRSFPADDRPLQIRADPGPHTAEARRGGALIAREFFVLDPGATRHVDLHVGAVAPVPVAPPPAALPAPGPPRDPGRVQRGLGWTAVGVGVTSSILAGAFLGLRENAMSQLRSACPALAGCSASVAPIVGDGKTDAALVNVFGVLGGVAAVAGVALLVLAPSAARSPASPVDAAQPVAALRLRGDGSIELKGWF